MRKPTLFEGLILLSIVAIGLAIYFLTANNPVAGSAAGMPGTVGPANWESSGAGSVSSVFLGNGTIYALSGDTGNSISAIDLSGKAKWNYTVPGEWRVINVFTHPTMMGGYNGNELYWPSFTLPVFSVDRGVLYLYVRENRISQDNLALGGAMPDPAGGQSWCLEERLLALSPGGDLLWNVSISQVHRFFDDANIYVKDGRIYVFDDYNLTVLDDSGAKLFGIENVASQAAVDENGYVYVVSAALRNPQSSVITNVYKETGYMEPSDTVRAYSPDGELCWEAKANGTVIRPDLRYQFNPAYYTLPLYANGTLCLPLLNGVRALDPKGNTLWEKHYDEGTLFWAMPMDSRGNVYVYQPPQDGTRSLHVIARDGNALDRDLGSYSDIFGDPGTAGYRYNAVMFTPDDWPADLGWMTQVNVTAYDTVNDTALWSYVLVPNNRTVTVTNDNVASLLSARAQQDIKSNSRMGATEYYDWNSNNPVTVIPDRDAVLIMYQASRLEWPVVMGKSNCTYASEIRVLDKRNGTLLYNISLGSRVASAAANNSTIYYGTIDGRLVAQPIGSIAGGVALAALAYFFLRFFCLGVVSRAKSRLDKNENRNRVLRYIDGHPGATLYELVQGLGMNVGTVRYHLLILGVNRRIISHRADAKFVRYFTNSGAYSPDEQYALSLVKREGVGRLLGLLLEKPGLSNQELSKELNMRESNVSRYMSELTGRGIVVKDTRPDGMSSFSVKNEYAENMAFAIERVNGL